MDSEIIYEIFEVVFVITLFLVIVGAIAVISDPDFLHATTMGNEIKYLSFMKDDSSKIEIQIDKKFQINSVENKFMIKKDSKLNVEKEMVGNSQISQTGDIVVIS